MSLHDPDKRVVCLVEDDPHAASVIAKSVRSQGFSVQVCMTWSEYAEVRDLDSGLFIFGDMGQQNTLGFHEARLLHSLGMNVFWVGSIPGPDGVRSFSKSDLSLLVENLLFALRETVKQNGKA